VRHFDAFNGDADGICSLLQLRLDAPMDSVLVTGAKRDVALLQRVPAGRGDAVTALDISMAVNRGALLGLLECGATVQYFDHHFAGEVPVHPGLEAHIDTSPGVCTGMIVDTYLKGNQRVWARRPHESSPRLSRSTRCKSTHCNSLARPSPTTPTATAKRI